MGSLVNPKRTVAELKDLRALTGDDNGAQSGYRCRAAWRPSGTQWTRIVSKND